jgi:hypothetical protein
MSLKRKHQGRFFKPNVGLVPGFVLCRDLGQQAVRAAQSDFLNAAATPTALLKAWRIALIPCPHGLLLFFVFLFAEFFGFSHPGCEKLYPNLRRNVRRL